LLLFQQHLVVFNEESARRIGLFDCAHGLLGMEFDKVVLLDLGDCKRVKLDFVDVGFEYNLSMFTNGIVNSGPHFPHGLREANPLLFRMCVKGSAHPFE